MDHFHTLDTPTLIKELKSTSSGLSAVEAERRLMIYGKNQIKAHKKGSILGLFLKQFWNIMLLILSIASALSFYFGEVIDGVAIGVVILLNVVISFFQEYKAERAVEALKKLMAPYALVRRGSQTLKIPAENVVPGDLLVLEEGMYITADARIIEAQELHTLEASLTGESNPIEKTKNPPKKISSLGDLCNSVFMGTVVSKGHGLAIVSSTGMQTEFGKIASLVQEGREEDTPLQKEMSRMIRKLAVLVGGIIGLLFVLGYLQGREIEELILTSISLGVSVIPEGLPTVITLTLAIGVQSMAKERAIVKRLSAAETLGAITFICSDKTGTLTQNQMTVERIYLNGEVLQFEGDGYDPKEKLPTTSPELDALLTGAVLCNNATLFKNKTGWGITGDPTEGALLTLAKRGGFDRLELEEKFPRKNELVFDSDRKRMSTLHKNGLWCKGAPDTILSVCDSILINGKREKLSPKWKKEILSVNENLAKEAYRVLAIAHKEEDGKFEEKGLTLIGLVGMMDPPRKEAAEAIRICHEAQIKVTMITGDHALTAQAIGKSLGLFQKGDLIMTGEELENCPQKELLKKVEAVRIFARVSPKHKVRILEALRERGNVVAMTGDGINDAPALKRADIGVAMGITGTDVSKEASDLILTDDNFTTIVKAVEKGRIIYQNIKKSIRFLLCTNFSEILLVSILFILGEPAPFIPLQILWINLLTDTFPAIALGFDAGDEDTMKQSPRKKDGSLWRDLMGTSLVSAIFFVICAVIYFQIHKEDVPLQELRSFMFTLTVVFQLFLAFAVRFPNRHFFHQFFSNPWLLFSIMISLALQFIALYIPFFQEVLETNPLDAEEWLWIVGICSIATLAIELWKFTRKKIQIA